MVGQNFQGLPFTALWNAQRCCGRPRGVIRADTKPTQPDESQATAQPEHFELCHHGKFACSVIKVIEAMSTKEQRAVSRYDCETS